MNELKPCPFCNRQPVITKEDCYGYSDDEWMIFCEKCDLQFGFSKQFKTKEEAIKKWNKRL